MQRSAIIRAITVLVALGLPPGPANSGAWMRDKGALFLSVSAYKGIDAQARAYETQEVYFEYGLKADLTLGFDGYDTLNPRNARLVLFVRREFETTRGANRFAMIAGLGNDGPRDTMLLRLGAGWGRNLANGWVGLDAHADFLPRQSFPDVKAEATLGRRAASGNLLLLRLTAERPQAWHNAVWLSPGYVWKISDHLHVEATFSGELLRMTEMRLKLGTWLSF